MNRNIILATTIILLGACSTKEIDIQTLAQEDVIFYASFDQSGEEGTKVYATEDLYLRWNADDRITIFNKYTFNQEYRFTGETGDNSGSFKKVDNGDFVTGNELDNIYAIYPYVESTRISDTGVINVTLPAEQEYAENTFGLGANTMVSATTDNQLLFKNVGGYLMLKLYGEGVSVSSITLKGNNGEKLAGKATLTMPQDGVPSVEMADEVTAEITLSCPIPVQLGSTEEECTQFWFVVPPITFSKGFTLTVNDSLGGTFEKSTSKSVTIERNHLSKMAPIELVPVLNARKYLTFTSEGTTKISLNNNQGNAPMLYYSFDKTNWMPWEYYSALTFTNSQSLYICGDNPEGFSFSVDKYSTFTASGSDFDVSGDVMSLIDNEHDLTAIPSEYCFRGLFQDCYRLKSAPDLPATKLTEGCYWDMFYGCLKLKAAPELPATAMAKRCYQGMFARCNNLIPPVLPATVLAENCYSGMFCQCYGLTTAQELPAMVLSEGCYSGMFEDCTNLTTAPELPATTLGEGCYAGMFRGCIGLANAPALPAMVMAENCYSDMFAGCTNLTTAPALPAMVLAEYCYSGMFNKCSSLTSAPELPAITLLDGCYEEMFKYCSKLEYVKCLATDTSAPFCLMNWLSGVAKSGTFIKAPEKEDWGMGASGIPIGWTVVDDTPILIPEAIDLGLSVKWASFNLGASKPEENGDFYAYGETKGYGEEDFSNAMNYAYNSYSSYVKTVYYLDTYKWCNGTETTLTKYCYKSSYGLNGFVDNKNTLDPEDDAAHVNLGGKWRMPTKLECEELVNSSNCTWTLTSINGVNGYLITSKITGYTNKSIFLPFTGVHAQKNYNGEGTTGHYLTSSLRSPVFPDSAYSNGNETPDYAWTLNLYNESESISSHYTLNCSFRECGFPIRPVYAE